VTRTMFLLTHKIGEAKEGRRVSVRLGNLFDDDLFVDELLLHQITFWNEAKMLGFELEFHVYHGPAGPVLFDGEHYPVTVALAFIWVEGHVILRQNVKLVVHDDRDVAFVVESRTAPQVIEMQSFAF
jgi:hypothetical protein